MNDDEAICMIVPNALWNTVRVFSLSILLYGSKSNLLGETSYQTDPKRAKSR